VRGAAAGCSGAAQRCEHGVIEVLLLDIDGVLQFPRAGFVEAIERDYAWSEGYLAFQRELFRDAKYLQALTGEGDFLAVAARLLPRHVGGLTAPVFLDRWLSENIEPNDALIELIPRLTVRHVYLASNQEPRRGAHIERLYSGHSWLSGTLFSHQIGHCKPDRRYFAQVLQTIGRPADACLFIDDSESCVTAAISAGIPSIRFLDTEQLASELATRGLLHRM
jgi:HAD superfamily hydrolase (TIGR01509 family)